MDGTGLLFEPIQKLWTEKTPPLLLSYPPDHILGYAEIESFVLSRLPVSEPYVLIAESYSGPVAARIAARHPPMLRGLVLSATFVRRPMGWFGKWFRFLIGPYLFQPALTRFIADKIFKREGLPDEQIAQWIKAFGQVRPGVIAARLKEILEVEAFEDLRKCSVPVLCLYGQRDWLLPDRCRELIREAIPTAKMVGLDTPHLLLQDKPAEALREIQIFTQSLV